MAPALVPAVRPLLSAKPFSAAMALKSAGDFPALA
jgi:hypothetical protein